MGYRGPAGRGCGALGPAGVFLTASLTPDGGGKRTSRSAGPAPWRSPPATGQMGQAPEAVQVAQEAKPVISASSSSSSLSKLATTWPEIRGGGVREGGTNPQAPPPRTVDLAFPLRPRPSPFQDLLRVARLPRPEDLQLHRQGRHQQLLPLQRLQIQEEGTPRPSLPPSPPAASGGAGAATESLSPCPPRRRPCGWCGRWARPSRCATSSASSTRSRTRTARRTGPATTRPRTPSRKVGGSAGLRGGERSLAGALCSRGVSERPQNGATRPQDRSGRGPRLACPARLLCRLQVCDCQG